MLFAVDSIFGYYRLSHQQPRQTFKQAPRIHRNTKQESGSPKEAPPIFGQSKSERKGVTCTRAFHVSSERRRIRTHPFLIGILLGGMMPMMVAKPK